MSEIDELFERFVKERIYLKNVTPKTVRYYRNSWDSFKRFITIEFLKRGFNSAFISDLRALSNDFDDAINRKAQHKGKQVAATAGIDDLIGRGLHIVRELDVLVRNAFSQDPSALAAWESASHVERPTRKGRQGSDATPGPQPAQV
jgi:hypothetical protein